MTANVWGEATNTNLGSSAENVGLFFWKSANLPSLDRRFIKQPSAFPKSSGGGQGDKLATEKKANLALAEQILHYQK